jgi:hypothetical protein
LVRAVDVINLDAKYRLRKYMPGAELKKKGRLLYDVSTESVIEKERERLSGKPEIPVEEYNQEKKFAARQTRFDFQYTMWYCRTRFEYAKLYAPAAAPKQAYDRKKLADLAEHFRTYLSADRPEQISRKIGASIPVALGILQHAKIIGRRQFSRYREKVLDKIPEDMVKG